MHNIVCVHSLVLSHPFTPARKTSKDLVFVVVLSTSCPFFCMVLESSSKDEDEADSLGCSFAFHLGKEDMSIEIDPVRRTCFDQVLIVPFSDELRR